MSKASCVLSKREMVHVELGHIKYLKSTSDSLTLACETSDVEF